MANGNEVLNYLIPTGGWVISGDEYEGIQFLQCEPITNAQFDAGFAQYDAWKAEKHVQAAADKSALLEKLGLSQDDLKTLLS